MEYVREGDTVVVWKLDRLGRNMIHILQTVKELTERGVTLVSVPTASTVHPRRSNDDRRPRVRLPSTSAS